MNEFVDALVDALVVGLPNGPGTPRWVAILYILVGIGIVALGLWWVMH